MKSSLICVAIALACIAPAAPAADAPNPAAPKSVNPPRLPGPEEIEKMRTGYRSCIRQYAEKYAAAKETAGDIAAGALASCQQILRNTFTAPPMTTEQVDQTIDRIEYDAQKDATRIVIEKRFRPSK